MHMARGDGATRLGAPTDRARETSVASFFRMGGVGTIVYSLGGGGGADGGVHAGGGLGGSLGHDGGTDEEGGHGFRVGGWC